MLSIVAAVVLIASTGEQDSPAIRPSTEFILSVVEGLGMTKGAALTLPSNVLFSRRALRNARLIIQMRMLQLREERLECVREAILRRLPPELRPTGSPAPEVKQSDALHATSFQSEDCSWVSTLHKRRRLTG